MAKYTSGVSTKYVGPSNSRGGRIKGTFISTGASTTVPYQHEFSSTDNHVKLAETMLGSKKLLMCGTDDKGGFVFLKC